MAKVYKEGQFIVLEGTNMEGDAWTKGSSVYLDDVQALIDKYDNDHPLYKKMGKEIMTTKSLKDLISQAGASSELKLRVKLSIENRGSMEEIATLDIKHYDSNEALIDEDLFTEYFLISDVFLTEQNDKITPGGILRAAETTFTLHIGKKVNQLFLIIINNKYGGGLGDPPGSGCEIPPMN